MTDTQTRGAPARGRGSARGGRGGFGRSARGANRQANGDNAKDAVDIVAPEDEGELGEMKKQYASQMVMLRELFPDWNEIDLVFALQETDGDVQTTIDRITDGNVSQFSEVPKKTKERSRSKVKEPTKDGAETAPPSARGARARGGFDSARGTRGRGRGGARGGRGGRQAAGASLPPTADTPAFDTPPVTDVADNSWDQSSGGDSHAPAETTATSASDGQKSTLVPEGGAKKSWASIFATPKPAPPLAKPVTAVSSLPEDTLPPESAIAVEESLQPNGIESEVPVPPQIEETSPVEPPLTDTASNDASLPEIASVDITPSKDELTEDNLEHLPDVSNPAPVGTAASNAPSSRDPRSVTGNVTPLAAAQQQAPIGRPPVGGYATNAFRATGQPGRSASFQRKILEQQEAVVMPGNHAVDRAAVQFGSMGLNGDTDAAPLDVDEDREEAETRTQPPHPSPPSQPRASLPPAPRQPQAPTADAPSSQEAFGTPKQAPGLPAVPQQPLPQENIGAPGLSQQVSQVPPGYGQFGGRYGQANAQQETSAPTQKPYDPFGHQGIPPSQFDYPAHSQAPGQQRQQGLGGFTSATNDVSSYYTTDGQRNAYQNYYGGGFGHDASSQQDVGASQQRTASGFGAAAGGSNFPTSQAQQNPTRYGDTQNSGQNTPNPTPGTQNSGSQMQQAQQIHQQPHNQGGHGGNFPYGHPYYNSPYYAAYMNQYNSAYGGQGYGGAPFAAKSGMYGQPHHGYGMNPQSGYESTSPGNASGFGQVSQGGMHGRDSGLGSSLGGDFSRAGSTPSQTQQHSTGNNAFGAASDPFGRSQGAYQGQGPSSYGQQQNTTQQGTDESLKGFGEASKTGTGPSPSLSQQGRPGSTTNVSSQAGQSGLPPPQSHQQGFGGYGGHLNTLGGNQGSGYGGLGGLGGHQTGQGGGYNNYGAGFGNAYSGGYNRGGWGGNYGH
ncbi:hypothetical protein EV356DRAFT_522179 [Viridothelium virens]|uniref:RNA polymerase II degradation factor 1 n=1 Tax=Viridothelium virens TaxID=1048519 RepID=A0A6A6HH98_VIRVR|nr:hypothetical protein EV356DRAFT_522179 [Viridothelium virens]